MRPIYAIVLLLSLSACDSGSDAIRAGSWQITSSTATPPRVGTASKTVTCFGSDQAEVSVSQVVFQVLGVIGDSNPNSRSIHFDGGNIHGTKSQTAVDDIPDMKEIVAGRYSKEKIHLTVDMPLYGGIRQTIDIDYLGPCHEPR